MWVQYNEGEKKYMTCHVQPHIYYSTSIDYPYDTLSKHVPFITITQKQSCRNLFCGRTIKWEKQEMKSAVWTTDVNYLIR